MYIVAFVVVHVHVNTTASQRERVAGDKVGI